MSSWVEPKTNWDENYEPSPQDMNRMERNTHALRHQDIDFDGDKTFNGTVDFPGGVEGPLNVDGNLAIDGTLSVTGAASADTLNTGQGANNLHPMNQAVRTTDRPVFDRVSTGHGDNNLYPMNQGVRTTDNVTHGNLTLNGTFTPRSTFASGTWNLSSGQTSVVPRGAWWIRGTESAGGWDSLIEVQVGGAWRVVITGANTGLVISDGTNVRMRNRDSGWSMTITWLRI